MQSKRIARIEHQLSMNIKETQHRIWTEVTKDVSFLRRVLNEIHLMKFTVNCFRYLLVHIIFLTNNRCAARVY